MCGITGIVAPAGATDIDRRLNEMVRAQAHRGPDGHGVEAREVAGSRVALGHLRLAIIDLSDAGAQPMISRCGRNVIVFNGEIYNYREVATELRAAGVELRTQTDTEVLLEALLLWGDDALAKLNGMWAFALLQTEKRRLLLSRDRFGVKPLYVHIDGDRLYFASEIKAILAATQKRFRPNTAVVDRYLGQALLDAQSETFFEGITAIPAGHSLEIDLAAKERPGAQAPRRYWSIESEQPWQGSDSDTIDYVRETFRDSVRLRLRSDVPVGVLLSGGIDSSAIATTMKHLGGGDGLHLLSAVSDDARFDESRFIDRMTEYLGCAAHKVRLAFSAEQMFDLLQTVSHSNDEPVGSFSYVAHYLLMQQARALGVTVLLSGQGADEMLCGYRKYLGFYAQALLRQGRIADAVRLVAGFATNGTVVSQFRFDEAKRYLPRVLRAREIDVRGPRLRDGRASLDVGLGSGRLEDRQRLDLYHYSVPALVHYEDRMSMAFGREIRLPFLDYRFVASVIRLRPDLKLRHGWTKWVFRKALESDLPSEICWRKDKQGFVNPQALWLRRELKPRIESMLREPMVAAQLGLLDQSAFARRFAAYCSQGEGGGAIGYRDVFSPIALEIWARTFQESLAEP
ncbi:MAG: asparagine synthase (glutamine-hydrolyzing) [Myxococcales bacterium]|nr:asparagine synthase (glutamine-hydrolyzing) [Myxococcales bacterium]